MKKLSEKFNAISVKRGELFEVNLHAQSGAGYEWDVVVTSGKVTFLGKDFMPEDNTASDPESVGGGMRQRFLFKADETGMIEMKAHYKRLWEQRPNTTRTFRVKVD